MSILTKIKKGHRGADKTHFPEFIKINSFHDSTCTSIKRSCVNKTCNNLQNSMCDELVIFAIMISHILPFESMILQQNMYISTK